MTLQAVSRQRGRELCYLLNAGVRSYRQGHPVVTRKVAGSSPAAPVVNNTGMLQCHSLCTRETDGCKRRNEAREDRALSKYKDPHSVQSKPLHFDGQIWVVSSVGRAVDF